MLNDSYAFIITYIDALKLNSKAEYNSNTITFNIANYCVLLYLNVTRAYNIYYIDYYLEILQLITKASTFIVTSIIEIALSSSSKLLYFLIGFLFYVCLT